MYCTVNKICFQMRQIFKGVDFFSTCGKFKTKIQINLPYNYMVLNSIWQIQTYIQTEAICLIFGQILHFWRIKFLATFKIKFCSQCTMYWGGQCRNLGWWPFWYYCHLLCIVLHLKTYREKRGSKIIQCVPHGLVQKYLVVVEI